MGSEKYICPRCGKEMIWTGDVCQDLKESYCGAILFVYKCGNYDCNYMTKYKRLDSAGEQSKYKIDMGMIE